MSDVSTAELKTKVAIDKVTSAAVNTASAVKSGVATATDAMTPEGKQYEQNIINILGEQTALTPTGLSPQETAIVEFDAYYLPEELKDQATILKNTMRALFNNKSKDITNVASGEELPQQENEVYPPCGDYEKLLVLASLLYRAKKLRQQLYEEGILNQQQLLQKIAELNQSGREKSIQGRDSAISRTHLEHLDALQKFIDTYDSEQKCIDIGELAYKDIGLELTDEQVEALLKQFIFFILQTHYPLKEFRTKDPTAPGFVKRLEKRKIDFDPYMSAYTKSGNKIPVAIAKVLDSIKGDNALLQKTVLEKVEEERKRIIDEIASKFPDGDPFLQTLRSSNDPSLVVDRLRTQIKEYTNGYKALETQKTSLEAKAKACEQAKALLEAEKNRLNVQVTKLTTDLKGKEGSGEQVKQLEESKAAAEAALNARIAEVTQQRDAIKAECDKKDAEIARLTKLNSELTTQVETAKQEFATLKSVQDDAKIDIDVLKQKHIADLAAKDLLIQAQKQRADAAVASSNRVAEESASLRTELSAAEGGIEIAKEELERLEAVIAEKEHLLAQANALAATRAATISEQEEQLRGLATEQEDLQSQIDTLDEAATEIGKQLEAEREKSGGLDTTSKRLEDQLKSLQEQILGLQTKLKDCDAETAKLAAENNTLKEGKLQEGQLEIARLTGELKTAEVKRDAAESKRLSLEAEINALKSQLEGEQGKVQSLTAERDATKEKLEEASARLDDKNSQLQSLADSKQSYKQEAEAKKTELNALKEKYDAEIASHETDLEKQKMKIETTYDGLLTKLEASFNETLKERSESAEQRITNLTDDFENQLTQATSDYTQLRKVVEGIATSIDTGKEISVEGAPQEEALEKIVTKLKGTASSGFRIDSSVNHCYLVFLTSYLWRLVFGGSGEEHANNIRYILYSTFHGGKGSVTGLYSDFGCSKEKAHSKPMPQGLEGEEARACECHKESAGECELIYGLQETTVIKSYLEYIGKLLQKMVDTSYDTKTETIYTRQKQNNKNDVKIKQEKLKQERFAYFIKSYIEKLIIFRNQFPVYKRDGVDRYTFLDTCTKHYSEFFKPAKSIQEPPGSAVRQSSLQDKYLVILRSTGAITIETSLPKGKDTKLTAPSDVNFALLFFTYIVLLRDYLNHVKQTGKDICPLPAILTKETESP